MPAYMFDPPSGWMYGFPRPVPQEILESPEALATYLSESGYPFHMISLALRHSRTWLLPVTEEGEAISVSPKQPKTAERLVLTHRVTIKAERKGGKSIEDEEEMGNGS